MRAPWFSITGTHVTWAHMRSGRGAGKGGRGALAHVYRQVARVGVSDQVRCFIPSSHGCSQGPPIRSQGCRVERGP